MKVAVASINGMISSHFGQSETFEIYEVNQNELSFIESKKAPEHTHGSLPNFLVSSDIELLICGNLGVRAIQILNANGVDVLSGAEGYVDDVINQFAKGTLVSKNLTCNEHNHEHNHDHDHDCHHD